MRVSSERRAALKVAVGKTEPRLWTRPLRPLTPETSHGFEVIEFARLFLGVVLRPWQQWLLIHALELNEDGTYRFRKVVVLVGRQNGKTKLIEVLAAYWLFMDSDRHTDHVPAAEFLVLGAAQDRDTAKKVWRRVLAQSNPEVLANPHRYSSSEVEAVIPSLAKRSAKPSVTNGSEAVRLRNGAQYQIAALATGGSRGASVSRAILDELREQRNWDGWSSFSKTLNGTYNSQLWAISSAGDSRSVVLADIRAAALRALEDWNRYVETGISSLEEYVLGHDVATGLFEWSALEGLDIDDPDGICQANPSIGYGYSVDTLLSDLETDPEAVFRTEVLCQWVLTLVEPHIAPGAFALCADGATDDSIGSRIQPGSEIGVGIDTSAPDRKMSYIAVAGWREDGLPHVEVVAQRTGMLWLPEAVEELTHRWPVAAVGVQPRGCPAGEFIVPLSQRGVTVLEVGGAHLGAAVGQFRDRVEAGTIRHRDQPNLNMSISGSVARRLGDVFVIDREASAVDAAVLVAVINALYALVHAGDSITGSSYQDHGLLVA